MANPQQQVDAQLEAAYKLLKRVQHWGNEGNRREVVEALPDLLAPYIKEVLEHFKLRDYDNYMARFTYLRAAALWMTGDRKKKQEAQKLVENTPTYNCLELQLCESLFG